LLTIKTDILILSPARSELVDSRCGQSGVSDIATLAEIETMKQHPRKKIIFLVVIVAAIALTQSGQHGQITDYISSWFEGEDASE
jgi:hypothetical protein